MHDLEKGLMPLLIDICAGRLGWSMGFIEHGWKVRAYDLVKPSIEIPECVDYRLQDILTVTVDDLMDADFLVASTPCEGFSVHCMKHFHPNPPFPTLGIQLFNHIRDIFEASGKPYVMENVRCAEKFVGRSVNHCGPFYLWGNAVPAIMPRELYKVVKGCNMGHFGANGTSMKTMTREQIREERRKSAVSSGGGQSRQRAELTAKIAQIPIGLSRYLASLQVESQDSEFTAP